MTTLQSNDATGEVVIFGNPAYPPRPKPGYTIEQVATLPPGPGKLVRRNGVLVREPLPQKPVPSLTARQLRLWIIGANISLEAVEEQIESIENAGAKAAARVEWEYATEYKHDHPLVLQIGAALGLGQVQIDAAFRAAALL